MGNPKQKWTAEEEEALRAGVAKHGTGKWKNIQKDPEFNHHLYTRSNIDLKDKWRNMSVSAGGQGPRDKSSRLIKPKSESDAADASYTAPTPLLLTNIHTPAASSTPPVTASSTAPAPASSISPTHDALPAPANDASKCSLDVKTASKYDNMIYDALKNLNDPNGSDATAIVSFIEQKQEVPQNFRRLLVSRLRRLVTQEKLEKVHNCYRTKNDAAPGAKGPTPKPKDIRPRQPQPTSYLPDTVHDAAKNAAFKIAVADNKESVAAEAGKESDRINKMTEDAEMLLKVAEDIFDRCSRGEIVMVS
ncbi:single myb histone 4 [Daucus carota subsp. sativus]|uniref:single myb histone 4 n=1 Tax=Daucus carota subsp. sativus TaxID=79200 RepID=UPI0007B2E700|nr:PREDICTED: single myb histone 4-like [Daucus carota subsp. sativus]